MAVSNFNKSRVPIKKIARFTASGTWIVPAGVTYAIAHMMGGGGGVGTTTTGGDGGASSVAFAGGTVSGIGLPKTLGEANVFVSRAGIANTGTSAQQSFTASSAASTGISAGPASATFFVAGGSVTPAASITVTVGAGGAAGTNGASGGSGYVYIEYYE
jgi:hypothetical protein